MKAQRRRTLDGLLASFTVMIILALSAAVALAHDATVTQSDPAEGATVNTSPAQVVAQFSEELVTKSSTMKVVNAGGEQVSDGNGRVDLNDPDHKTMIATLLKPLADGAYTVQWHALLTDGDASDGTFGFTVKSGAAPARSVATVAPAATPAMTATAVPTAVLKADGAGAAAAQPTAVPPTTTPTTLGSAAWPAGWFAAGLGIIVITFGTIALLRRRAR
jgi:copper resistance protein C